MGSSAERNLGICLVQVRADVDALLDDWKVLVEWKTIDGSARQLQNLQPVLLSLSHQKEYHEQL